MNGEVLHGSLLQLILEHGNVLKIDILQSSVETHSRCGGIFKYEFVANLPLSLSVKKFQKSVNIWGSYGQDFGVLFFLRHSVVQRMLTIYGPQTQRIRNLLTYRSMDNKSNHDKKVHI